MYPDVKGREILRGAAPMIMDAAPLKMSLPFTSGCMSSSKQAQWARPWSAATLSKLQKDGRQDLL